MATSSTEAVNQGSGNKEGGEAFSSKLKEGRERFLAHVIEHGLECGRRTPEDFIRHFPPTAIMNGLANHPNLRSQILVLTTGIKQKIAMKKSAQSAGEDLQIALDEGETDADSIVALFHPDDRIRYLEDKKLWSYIIEGEFWTVSATKREDFERAKSHIAFMLDRALQDKLVTHRDIVDGLTVNELATRLPKDKLGKIIQQALTSGQQGQPFTDVELLTAMPPSSIVDYVSLDHIWQNVVVSKIAQAHSYVEDTGETVKQALNWLDTNGNKEAPAKEAPAKEAPAKEAPAKEAPAKAEDKNKARTEETAKPKREAKSAAKGEDKNKADTGDEKAAAEATPATNEGTAETADDEVEVTDDDIRIG